MARSPSPISPAPRPARRRSARSKRSSSIAPPTRWKPSANWMASLNTNVFNPFSSKHWPRSATDELPSGKLTGQLECALFRGLTTMLPIHLSSPVALGISALLLCACATDNPKRDEPPVSNQLQPASANSQQANATTQSAPEEKDSPLLPPGRDDGEASPRSAASPR